MRLEGKVDQLAELMADLIPTVDKLAQSQTKLERTVSHIEVVLDRQTKIQERIHTEMSEMRLSNIKLAGAIEKLTKKIDRVDEFDKRLKRIEKIVLK